jgi:hypothetical protein
MKVRTKINTNAPPDLPEWGGADIKVPHLGDLGDKKSE